MAASCASVCFGLFLTISSLLYIGEMLFNGMFVRSLYFNDELKQWFVPYIGLLLLPMVTVQLVSAVLLLMKKADKLSTMESVLIAIIHILQLGFLWRHFSLFREIDPVSRSRDMADLNLLQSLHTFSSMLPLLFIQSYFIMHHSLISDWLTIATVCTTLIGSCWYLASFRRHHHENETVVLTWPGTIFRFLWRCGEIVSRIISLTVFTSMYYYWVFLILGLHGLTMLVCLCTSVLGMFEKPGVSRSYKVLMGVLVAYMYSFCFINLSSSSTTFRYTFYYIVMFLENVVLTTVWYLKTDQSDGGNTEHLIMFISGSAFFVGIISMVMYYKCFHINASKDFEQEHMCETDGCINCRLSVCSKHNIKLQRPFSAGWLSQYQQAVTNGHYYKNIMQDTMIDSEWESVHDTLNSSGEHWQIRDTDLESVQTSEKKKFTSMQASGTYTHKRFFNSDQNCSNRIETDSISSGSGIYEEDWRQRPDAVMTQLSLHDSHSVLSSQTQLLTDSWDNLIKQNESVSKDPKHPKRMDILNSLIRTDLDTSFFSDGYTTDHTMDSYQLPVTVLAKKRSRQIPRKEKFEKEYSIASDSTDCTICAFMRQNPSSPEESRRNFRIHENIPEEVSTEKRPTKRDHGTQTVPKHKRRKTKISDPSNGQSVYYAKVNKRRHATSKDFSKSAVSKTPEATSYDGPYTQKHRNHQSKQSPLNKVVKNISNINSANQNPTEFSTAHLQKYSLTDHSDLGNVFTRKISLTNNSDSGDSAFPRNTPLSSYLVATDDDQDGKSESSCEMII